ncbi:hypothetical protein [uncultured Aquimarina sp.]|uniref:hypothetical protein n=1 Tax=uncultured Aquimarina sp. TaxID=575652 RepID=UPI0026163002|nr:hypothetical protein [uncultured Aquimarina sp.]
MKKILVLGLVLISSISLAQSDVKMKSDYSSDNPEIRDILEFQGIEYLKMRFAMNTIC